MKWHQVCLEAKIVSCTDHEVETDEEAIEEALDDLRADGYEIIDYDAHVDIYDEEE